jgi:hypothetical protein
MTIRDKGGVHFTLPTATYTKGILSTVYSKVKADILLKVDHTRENGEVEDIMAKGFCDLLMEALTKDDFLMALLMEKV